jgi:phytoene synthase
MPENLSLLDVEDAYEYCRVVAKRHAKAFYFASNFLPVDKRKSIHAVYALCRYVDDLVDREEDKFSRKLLTREKIVMLVEQWKMDLDECYSGKLIKNPIMTAWLDTLTRYKIPKNLPLELIEGVCMDLTFRNYESFSSLYTYCYKVASVVGLMTSEVFGYASKDALDHAIKLGVAMQLTNILRDVNEDMDKGRIYLPKEDLLAFNYSEDDLKKKVYNDNFIRLMKFQVERAKDYYADSDKGIPLLSEDSRLAVKVSRVNYSQILDQIEDMNYNVFRKRAYVSLPKKLINLPFAWLQLRLY